MFDFFLFLSVFVYVCSRLRAFVCVLFRTHLKESEICACLRLHVFVCVPKGRCGTKNTTDSKSDAFFSGTNDSESGRIVKYYRGSILLQKFQRDSAFSTKGSFGFVCACKQSVLLHTLLRHPESQNNLRSLETVSNTWSLDFRICQDRKAEPQDHGKGGLSSRGVAVMTETAMTAETAKTIKTATVASLCCIL